MAQEVAERERVTAAVPAGTVQVGPAGRLVELDALRGLAALAVACDHALLATRLVGAGGTTGPPLITYSPLHVFWAGGEAVILFFVLSGFVLGLPGSSVAQGYGGYLWRRLRRLYIPYWAAVGTAIVLRALVGHGPITGGSDWLNRVWAAPLSPGLVVQHLFLVGSFPNGVLIPVVWSLVHIARVSVAYPVMAGLGARFGWGQFMGLAYACAGSGLVATYVCSRIWRVDQDYTITLLYVPAFAMGITLARYRVGIVAWVSRQPSMLRVASGLAAWLLYTSRWWLLPHADKLHAVVGPTVIGASSCAFIVLALGSRRLGRALRWRALVGAGRISYSLYLTHALCIVVTVRLLAGHMPVPYAAGLGLLVAVPVAYGFYSLCEAPVLRLGRRGITAVGAGADGGTR